MSEFDLQLERYEQLIQGIHFTRDIGKVIEVNGMVIRAFLPGASIGSVCEIQPNNGGKSFLAEVIGFKEKSVLLMPLDEMHGVSLGSKIELSRQVATVRVSPDILGQVIDGMGNTFDKSIELEKFTDVSIYREVRSPLDREPIRKPLDLGVRAINGLLSVGMGQRIAIMAGSGVGKSVLLGMIARYCTADVNVIALIGERGREVREFIENDLGREGMARTVVVCVTSDQSPLLRVRGAYVAMAIAEYFADRGKNVMLMMDSVTRFAMALREVGLSSGEPPSTKGYTPSVFAKLPKLLERAGHFTEGGSITGLYTTLVEGDDMNDPIGDSVRSIVDGHIVLTRALAHKAHFPAIDILQSISRVMKSVTEPAHQNLALKFREVMATYKEAEDLINIGAYKAGSNTRIDRAIRLNDAINQFLCQDIEDRSTFNQSIQLMQSILN